LVDGSRSPFGVVGFIGLWIDRNWNVKPAEDNQHGIAINEIRIEPWAE
jgi:hypothetical protein